MNFIETKIRDDLWCFEQNKVRSFLLIGAERSLLIDSCYGGDLRGLCESKTRSPIQLILTHSDRDHIGCMDQFDTIYIHPAEFQVFPDGNKQSSMFHSVDEGTVFDIGTYCLEVLHIPGHTPGSIALLERGKHFLFGGDSIQTGPIYMFGQGRNMDNYKASMEKLDNIRNLFDVIYASHHQLAVNPAVVHDLYVFAEEIRQGNFPPPLPLPVPPPPSVPDTVRLFARGAAQFYL